MLLHSILHPSPVPCTLKENNSSSPELPEVEHLHETGDCNANNRKTSSIVTLTSGRIIQLHLHIEWRKDEAAVINGTHCRQECLFKVRQLLHRTVGCCGCLFDQILVEKNAQRWCGQECAPIQGCYRVADPAQEEDKFVIAETTKDNCTRDTYMSVNASIPRPVLKASGVRP